MKTTHILKGNSETGAVYLDGKLLDPEESQKVINHSPDGFNWGYNGSGCAQLALAIVLKLTGKSDGYMKLKEKVIANIPKGKDFEIKFLMMTPDVAPPPREEEDIKQFLLRAAEHMEFKEIAEHLNESLQEYLKVPTKSNREQLEMFTALLLSKNIVENGGAEAAINKVRAFNKISKLIGSNPKNN